MPIYNLYTLIVFENPTHAHTWKYTTWNNYVPENMLIIIDDKR